MPPIIALQDLRFRWSSKGPDILHIANFALQKGEHLLLQGKSGSGKTTLLNLLTGVNLPTAGLVQLLNVTVNQLSALERDRFRADQLGVIFQQFNLLPYLSVQENIQLACTFSARKRERVGDVKREVAQLLERLHISAELWSKPVTQLSMGQQQRVAIARGVIGKPPIIIADEPTSAMDDENRDAFLQLLFQEADAQQSTILFVSHDKAIAPYFRRVVQLSEINQVVPKTLL